MTVEQLAKYEHPYYGTGTYHENYDSFIDFYNDMRNYDVDLNFCYRWDVIKHDDGTYSLNIFIIQQRKGCIVEHSIYKFTDSDVPLFFEYLKEHMKTMKNMWMPFDLYDGDLAV